MAIPFQVAADVQALAAACTANAPLNKLPRLQLSILQSQASAVVAEVDAALAAAGGALDADDPAGYPGAFGDYLLALAQASEDQATLCDVRGLVGRAAFNLNQVFS